MFKFLSLIVLCTVHILFNLQTELILINLLVWSVNLCFQQHNRLQWCNMCTIFVCFMLWLEEFLK